MECAAASSLEAAQLGGRAAQSAGGHSGMAAALTGHWFGTRTHPTLMFSTFEVLDTPDTRTTKSTRKSTAMTAMAPFASVYSHTSCLSCFVPR